MVFTFGPSKGEKGEGGRRRKGEGGGQRREKGGRGEEGGGGGGGGRSGEKEGGVIQSSTVCGMTLLHDPHTLKTNWQPKCLPLTQQSWHNWHAFGSSHPTNL